MNITVFPIREYIFILILYMLSLMDSSKQMVTLYWTVQVSYEGVIRAIETIYDMLFITRNWYLNVLEHIMIKEAIKNLKLTEHSDNRKSNLNKTIILLKNFVSIGGRTATKVIRAIKDGSCGGPPSDGAWNITERMFTELEITNGQ